MSFGNCPKCHEAVTIDEYNAARYTNTGNGGMCFKCIGITLAEIAKKDADHILEVGKMVAEIAALKGRIKELEADALKGRIKELEADVQKWIRIAGENQKSANKSAEAAEKADARIKELEASNRKLREAVKNGIEMYDELAMSPLEAAAKYGPDYMPPTEEYYLEVRGMMKAALEEGWEG